MIIYPAYKDRYEHSEHLKHVIRRITHVSRDVSNVHSYHSRPELNKSRMLSIAILLNDSGSGLTSLGSSSLVTLLTLHTVRIGLVSKPVTSLSVQL